MDSTSFCSECPCVDGSGKRGFHMAYVAAPVPWDKDRPFACAFCHHTSLPVAEAQAFKEPPRPIGIPKSWTYDVNMKAWVSPTPDQPKATVQWGAEHGARFLMVDHGDRIVRFNRSKSGTGGESAFLDIRVMDDRGCHHVRMDADELAEFTAWLQANKPA